MMNKISTIPMTSKQFPYTICLSKINAIFLYSVSYEVLIRRFVCLPPFTEGILRGESLFLLMVQHFIVGRQTFRTVSHSQILLP
uniref:EF-hand domain-containing protein n=1 Tax=Parascaris univalens TaxID=6257 RepID=A0A915A7M7_PARUN